MSAICRVIHDATRADALLVMENMSARHARVVRWMIYCYTFEDDDRFTAVDDPLICRSERRERGLERCHAVC